MSAYTKDEIKAKLVALDLQIAAAEKDQVHTAGGPGQAQHTQRGDLGAMYRERERLERKYEELEALTSGGGRNLARFPRPL